MSGRRCAPRCRMSRRPRSEDRGLRSRSPGAASPNTRLRSLTSLFASLSSIYAERPDLRRYCRDQVIAARIEPGTYHGFILLKPRGRNGCSSGWAIPRCFPRGPGCGDRAARVRSQPLRPRVHARRNSCVSGSGCKRAGESIVPGVTVDYFRVTRWYSKHPETTMRRHSILLLTLIFPAGGAMDGRSRPAHSPQERQTRPDSARPTVRRQT